MASRTKRTQDRDANRRTDSRAKRGHDPRSRSPTHSSDDRPHYYSSQDREFGLPSFGGTDEIISSIDQLVSSARAASDRDRHHHDSLENYREDNGQFQEPDLREFLSDRRRGRDIHGHAPDLRYEIDARRRHSREDAPLVLPSGDISFEGLPEPRQPGISADNILEGADILPPQLLDPEDMGGVASRLHTSSETDRFDDIYDDIGESRRGYMEARYPGRSITPLSNREMYSPSRPTRTPEPEPFDGQEGFSLSDTIGQFERMTDDERLDKLAELNLREEMLFARAQELDRLDAELTARTERYDRTSPIPPPHFARHRTPEPRYIDRSRESRNISPRERRDSSGRSRHSPGPTSRFPERRPYSPEPRRISHSPPRYQSPGRRISLSPARHRFPEARRRSISPARRRSITPPRRRSITPLRRRSISPPRRRSLSPMRYPSPGRRRLSPDSRLSPVTLRSPRGRRKSLESRMSQSPPRYRAPPGNRRSLSPARRRSLSPRRMSPSPRRRSPPRYHRDLSPARRPMRSITPPSHRRSVTPPPIRTERGWRSPTPETLYPPSERPPSPDYWGGVHYRSHSPDYRPLSPDRRAVSPALRYDPWDDRRHSPRRPMSPPPRRSRSPRRRSYTPDSMLDSRARVRDVDLHRSRSPDRDRTPPIHSRGDPFYSSPLVHRRLSPARRRSPSPNTGRQFSSLDNMSASPFSDSHVKLQRRSPLTSKHHSITPSSRDFREYRRANTRRRAPSLSDLSDISKASSSLQSSGAIKEKDSTKPLSILKKSNEAKISGFLSHEQISAMAASKSLAPGTPEYVSFLATVLKAIQANKEQTQTSLPEAATSSSAPGYNPSSISANASSSLTYNAFCPLCSEQLKSVQRLPAKNMAQLKEHVHSVHLPWYISVIQYQVLNKEGDEFRRSILADQLHPVIFHSVDSLTLLPSFFTFLWGKLLQGFVLHLSKKLHLHGPYQLKSLVTQREYFPSKNIITDVALKLTDEEKIMMNAHQAFVNDSMRALDVSPPNCMSSVLHWITLVNVIASLPRSEQSEFALFSAYSEKDIYVIDPSATQPVPYSTNTLLSFWDCINHGRISQMLEIVAKHTDILKETHHSGVGPIQLALSKGHYAAARALLFYGAKVDERDRKDWTPLCRAAFGGNAHAVQILMAWGAKELRAKAITIAKGEGHRDVCNMIEKHNMMALEPIPADEVSAKRKAEVDDLLQIAERVKAKKARQSAGLKPVTKGAPDTCTMCDENFQNEQEAKNHFLGVHLPWYLSVNHSRKCGSTLYKVLRPALQSYIKLKQLPFELFAKLWGKLLHGFLLTLSTCLNLRSVADLPGFVTEKRLIPSVSTELTFIEKLMMKSHQIFIGEDEVEVTVSPPNCLSALLHWQCLFKVFLTMPAKTSDILSDIEVYDTIFLLRKDVVPRGFTPARDQSPALLKQRFWLAIEEGNLGVLWKMILENNDFVYLHGPSEKISCPIQSAVSRGHPNAARLLLLYGAPTHRKDARGFTPFLKAIFDGHIEAVSLLLPWMTSDEKKAAANLAKREGRNAIARDIKRSIIRDATFGGGGGKPLKRPHERSPEPYPTKKISSKSAALSSSTETVSSSLTWSRPRATIDIQLTGEHAPGEEMSYDNTRLRVQSRALQPPSNSYPAYNPQQQRTSPGYFQFGVNPAEQPLSNTQHAQPMVPIANSPASPTKISPARASRNLVSLTGRGAFNIPSDAPKSASDIIIEQLVTKSRLAPGRFPLLTGSNVQCSMCGENRRNLLDVKFHVILTHLPWYFALRFYKDGRTKSTSLARQLGPNVSEYFDKSSVTPPPSVFSCLLGKLLHGFLEMLRNFLGLKRTEDLVSFVTQMRLYPSTNQLWHDERLVIGAHREFVKDTNSNVSISPPNCLSAVLHWTTVTNIISKIPDPTWATIKSFEKYNSRNIVEKRPGTALKPVSPSEMIAMQECLTDGNLDKLAQILESNPKMAVTHLDHLGGITAIEYAIGVGKFKEASVLLLYGALVDQPNRAGWSPLRTEAERGNFSSIQFLTTWGSSSQAQEAHDAAMKFGHTKVCEFLSVLFPKIKLPGDVANTSVSSTPSQPVESASAQPTESSQSKSLTEPLPTSSVSASTPKPPMVVKTKSIMRAPKPQTPMTKSGSNVIEIDDDRDDSVMIVDGPQGSTSSNKRSPLKQRKSHEGCPLCDETKCDLNHVALNHLPWYAGLQSKMDFVKNLPYPSLLCIRLLRGYNFHKDFAPQLPAPTLRILGCLLHGMIAFIVNELCLSGPEDLLTLAVNENLWLDTNGKKSAVKTIFVRYTVAAYQMYTETKGLVETSPPNCVAGLLHWQTLINIIAKLPDTSQQILLTLETFTWEKDRPTLPYLTGTVAQPTTSATDASNLQDVVVDKFMAKLHEGNIFRVDESLETFPNLVYNKWGQHETGIVSSFTVFSLIDTIFHKCTILASLILHGAPVDAIDSQGMTALHDAASRNEVLATSMLLLWGADSTIRDARGKTATEVAEERGHLHISTLIGMAENDQWKDVANSLFLDDGSTEAVPGVLVRGIYHEPCLMCDSGTRSVEHVMKEHLPWYTSLRTRINVNSSDKRKTRLWGMFFTTLPLLKDKNKDRKDKNRYKLLDIPQPLKLILGKLLYDFLTAIAQELQLKTHLDLFQYAKQNKLDHYIPEGPDIPIDEYTVPFYETYVWVKEEAFPAQKSKVSSLLEWRTLSNLLRQLPEPKRDSLLHFEMYQWSKENPTLPTLDGPLLQPAGERDDLAAVPENVQSTFIGQIYVGSYPDVWDLLQQYPSLVYCKAPPHERGMVTHAMVFSPNPFGQTTVSKLLILCGAPIDEPDVLGRSALHHAVIKRRVMVVKTLLLLGADPQKQDSFGKSPLDLAKGKTHVDIASMLNMQNKCEYEKLLSVYSPRKGEMKLAISEPANGDLDNSDLEEETTEESPSKSNDTDTEKINWRCPICSIMTTEGREHCLENHLPWYVSPSIEYKHLIKGKRKTKLAAQVSDSLILSQGALVKQDTDYAKSSVPRYVKLLGQLHLGLLLYIAKHLGLANRKQLFKYTKSKRLWPGSNASFLAVDDFCIKAFQNYTKDEVAEVRIGPPNHVSALIHWNTLVNLISRLPATAQEEVVTCETYDVPKSECVVQTVRSDTGLQELKMSQPSTSHIPDITKEQFLEAIKSSNLTELSNLLDKYPHLVYYPIPTQRHAGPIWFAMLNMKFLVPPLLHLYGASPNQMDSSGMAPLHKAAQLGYLKPTEMLVELGADITMRNSKGYTALDMAKEKNHDKVRAILEAAAQGDVLTVEDETDVMEVVDVEHQTVLENPNTSKKSFAPLVRIRLSKAGADGAGAPPSQAPVPASVPEQRYAPPLPGLGQTDAPSIPEPRPAAIPPVPAAPALTPEVAPTPDIAPNILDVIKQLGTVCPVCKEPITGNAKMHASKHLPWFACIMGPHPKASQRTKLSVMILPIIAHDILVKGKAPATVFMRVWGELLNSFLHYLCEILRLNSLVGLVGFMTDRNLWPDPATFISSADRFVAMALQKFLNVEATPLSLDAPHDLASLTHWQSLTNLVSMVPKDHLNMIFLFERYSFQEPMCRFELVHGGFKGGVLMRMTEPCFDKFNPTTMQEFQVCVKSGDMEGMCLWLDTHPVLAYAPFPGHEHSGVIRVALEHNHLQMAAAARLYGADPNHRDHIGRTPLHRFAAKDNVKSIRCLLVLGASPTESVLDDGVTTPAVVALRKNSRAAYQLLIQEEERRKNLMEPGGDGPGSPPKPLKKSKASKRKPPPVITRKTLITVPIDTSYNTQSYQQTNTARQTEGSATDGNQEESEERLVIDEDRHTAHADTTRKDGHRESAETEIKGETPLGPTSTSNRSAVDLDSEYIQPKEENEAEDHFSFRIEPSQNSEGSKKKKSQCPEEGVLNKSSADLQAPIQP